MSPEGPLVVLHLVANRWWTGSADPVLHAVRGLRARGHRALLGLIPGGRFEAKAREAGLEPVPGLSLEARLVARGLIRDVLVLRRLVSAERVDIVHCHHAHDHWLGAACRGRARLVRTFHNARAVDRRWPATALYRRTDALIAVSAGVEARCRDAGLGPPSLARIDGVVDAARFAGAAGADLFRKELGLDATWVVGSVARLAPRRGHELLIRGFALFLAERPDARLVLIGKGERREALEAFVRGLGLAGHVIFAGYRDGDLPAALHALDAFALLGAGSDESCRAALEAMAAERPVLARDVGALADAVVHGETGLVIDDARPESVAAALRTLSRDPGRARAMGEAGRRRAVDLCSLERHTERLEDIYRQALARRRRGRSA
jgi:glycosyltransferase involved in cell wall biosynthesis